MPEKEPIRVVVTGAAGQIAYSLIYMIANGDVFGREQPVYLHLLDIPPAMGILEGVCMEIDDLAFPLVKGYVKTAEPKDAFEGADAAFLVGSMPRREGMERKDLLTANVRIFKAQGQALDQYAKKDVKVLVVGNPANTNAFICSYYAPSIPNENFTAMTRLDQNRAQALIAKRLNKSANSITNVTIWGNHSSTQFPDVINAKVGEPADSVSVYDAVKDTKWLESDFIKTVQTRGAAVISARKASSAMSAAKAAVDHMRDWWNGTPSGKWVSMGVLSDGSYGIPKDLVYSFPVTIANKKWTIVQGLKITDFARSKLDLTAAELIDEKKEAESICSA